MQQIVDLSAHLCLCGCLLLPLSPASPYAYYYYMFLELAKLFYYSQISDYYFKPIIFNFNFVNLLSFSNTLKTIAKRQIDGSHAYNLRI